MQVLIYLAWRQLLEILTDLHYTPQYSLLPFGIPFQVILFPFLWSWFIPLVVLQFQSVTSSYFSLTHAGLSRIKRHQGRPGERGRPEHQGRPGHHRRSGHRKKSEQETFNSSKCQKLQYVCLLYSLSIYIPVLELWTKCSKFHCLNSLILPCLVLLSVLCLQFLPT